MKDMSSRTPSESSDGKPTEVGVGPHPLPWPDDPRLDPELLEKGDRRNVADRYRYWRVDAVVADLDQRRHPFHVATENWRHDPNIGSVVRNANAFCAEAVHIVGKRRWNRRGAMMTEVYQHILHHEIFDGLVSYAARRNLPIVGIDNTPGARSLVEASIPERCIMLFGQEGSGLSKQAQEAASLVLAIPQFGSTRSINAGAASAVAMYEWCRRFSCAAPSP